MNKSIKSNNHCTGCGVCSVVCPQNAITMQTDKKGFCRPLLNSNCIECGICVKRCHEFKTYNGHSVNKSYTAHINNSQIRDDSSSGGVFSAIAMKAIERGGFVCGAGFDNDFVLYHQIIDDNTGIERLRKSKYIESIITPVWKDIKNRLQLNQFGVFVGTPCQCAALRSYLGKDFDNLLICDFICHGVASPVIFEKYKSYLSTLYGKPNRIEFRHKIEGKGSFFYYKGDKGEYMIPNYKTSYPYAYASGLIVADDCIDCQYCALERFSDITLGDYVKGDKDYSLSTIFTNTEKGFDFLQSCDDYLLFKEEELIDIIDKSWHLTKPNEYNPVREKVFIKINKSWNYLEKRFFRLSLLDLYIQALKNKVKKLLNIW